MSETTEAVIQTWLDKADELEHEAEKLLRAASELRYRSFYAKQRAKRQRA